MKRNLKNNFYISIKDLMNKVNPDTYTRQTLVSLFRCFLETIIENRYDSVILAKFNETKNFQNLLNRLKYTDIKLYSYSGNIEDFKQIELNIPQMENDEFLIINAERFSACIYWNSSSSDVFGLYEGFCTLNPSEVKKIVEHLQTVAYSKELEQDLSSILQDRRNNEKFTTILKKLVINLDSRQRDLICANTELKELYEKSTESEKLTSINQFFSTTMHELRNPLSVIDLHAKIITKNAEKIINSDKETLEKITNSSEIIRKTSKNLEKILSELLDFSKPLALEKTQDNIEESVKEIINLIKPSYEDKNVEILFKNSLNSQIMINFDKAKLHQVFFNLLKNALEASLAGDKVEILLENDEKENNVYLKILDEGPGISDEYKEKVFEPYFTTKKEGTGVGLAQARKIVEAHDGSLFIESNKIKGAAFVLLLPAKSLQIKM